MYIRAAFGAGGFEMDFDHIGLVVRDLARGRLLMTGAFGITDWTREFDDPVNGVLLQFGRDASGVCYELLQPVGEHSPLKGALKSGHAILNHVAYRVDDLAREAARLDLHECAPTAAPTTAIAYGGRRIQFFVTPLSFVMELIEAPGHRHAYTSGVAIL